MQQKLIKKILANFNIPILDILIFLNLDYGVKFRHELDHTIRNSDQILFNATKNIECKRLNNLDTINSEN